MNINEALSNKNIYRNLELQELSIVKFGKQLSCSGVIKNYKKSYDGLVETKDGKKFKVKIKEISKTCKSLIWKEI